MGRDKSASADIKGCFFRVTSKMPLEIKQSVAEQWGEPGSLERLQKIRKLHKRFARHPKGETKSLQASN